MKDREDIERALNVCMDERLIRSWKRHGKDIHVEVNDAHDLGGSFRVLSTGREARLFIAGLRSAQNARDES